MGSTRHAATNQRVLADPGASGDAALRLNGATRMKKTARSFRNGPCD